MTYFIPKNFNLVLQHKTNYMFLNKSLLQPSSLSSYLI